MRQSEKFLIRSPISHYDFCRKQLGMLLKLFVGNYFFVLAFYQINIVVGLKAFLNIAEAIFKLARRVQNTYAGAKRLCERKILHSPHFVQTSF